MISYNKTVFTSFLIIFATIGIGYGQKIFIDENISYWYNVNNDVHMNHNIYFEGDSAYLYLEIDFNDKLFDDFHYVIEYHESYHKLDIDQADTIIIQDHIIAIKSGIISAHFKLPRKEKVDLVVIKTINKKSGIDFTYDIPFIENYNFSTDGLVLFEQDDTTPLLKNFVNKDQPILVKSISGYSDQIYVYYYAENFDEAVPPMVIKDNRASKELRIDSVFTIQLDQQLSLIKEGLYFFQKDSSSANGIGIRVQDPYFPLVKTFDKVLEPLIYISTRDETNGIKTAPDPKKAFEKYWINLVKIPSLATITVQKYYERVEAANYLFTNFKEGWKSDMGLIYIIYGPPNDVYKSEEIIDWVYNRDLTMPTVRFSFYKVKNVFAEDHYSLLRKKNYDKNWFRSVELWRNGKK